MTISWLHQRYVHQRRIEVLASHLGDMLVENARVLDVGCGDGQLASILSNKRPDIHIRGIDVLVREQTAIPVEPFDGQTIPAQDDAFDAVVFVDVLHHTDDPQPLLAEAKRVSKQQILLKDHYRNGIAAQQTLAFMDNVGNKRHGVEIPCNYLSRSEWDELFDALELTVNACREKLGLYPPPLSWAFERGLHFIAALSSKPQN